LNVYGQLFRKEDVRLASYEVLPTSAQHTNVPRVVFYEKRARRPHYFQRDGEARYILVLAGSGHPVPERHPAYDLRTFDAMINGHIATNHVEVLVDFRFYVYDEAFARRVSHLNSVPSSVVL
jgi:hypothetical protein